MNPQFPVYVISKGRWQDERRLTSKTFERMNMPFRMIVEEQEFENYAATVGREKLLILPPKYKEEYDTCEVGPKSGRTGSGPARNFAWQHSLDEGHRYHWIVDDNIRHFYRFHKNLKTPVADGTIFRCMEDFVLRYNNVAMAGPEYRFFITRKELHDPFRLNTRIYSCILINNFIPFRWRAMFNEDTDLSLRALKDGWCTVLFQAFLQGKEQTQVVRGGNTDEIYTKGTLEKSKMLVRLHPDLAKMSLKYGREHHHVDYSVFKQPLRRRAGVEMPRGINDYGMKMVDTTPEMETY